ncbi:hypothetical protein [Enhygromyxa salina]|nr:hypothetical protein [Enhygromyxa salina]
MRGLRLLTLAPRVDEQHPGVLRARTPLLMRLLTLGAVYREVIVDRRSRYVIIERRLLWGLRRQRVIPFRIVRRIVYDYDRTVTSLRAHLHGVDSGDEIERFDVALVVATREDVPDSHAHLYEEQVPLFSFHGEGQGGGLILRPDLEGQQEQLSRRYVERLRELLGVGFGNELEQLSDDAGRAWSCSGCGRPGPPRAGRCYYCGGQLEITKS